MAGKRNPRTVLDLPPEPPVGSIITDCDGNVWERASDGWWPAVSCGDRWENIQQYAPFTVLREGPSL